MDSKKGYIEMLKNVYLGTHMECAGRITIIILASNGQYWCGNRIWNYYQDYFHTTNSYHPINFLSPLINCCTGLPNKKILWSHLETKFFWEQTIAYKHCPLVYASLALAIGCFRKRCEQDEKPKRCFWVWKIYSEESKKRGQWKNLFSELVEDDRECYFNLCISQEKTNYWNCIPAKKRFIITLPYLPERCWQQALSLSFQVGKSTFSKISKEVYLPSSSTEED